MSTQARRELIADAIYRALREHAEAQRLAQGLRIALNGKGPRVQRGTGRSALTMHLTAAVLAALDSEEPGRAEAQPGSPASDDRSTTCRR